MAAPLLALTPILAQSMDVVQYAHWLLCIGYFRIAKLQRPGVSPGQRILAGLRLIVEGGIVCALLALSIRLLAFPQHAALCTIVAIGLTVAHRVCMLGYKIARKSYKMWEHADSLRRDPPQARVQVPNHGVTAAPRTLFGGMREIQYNQKDAHTHTVRDVPGFR